MYRRSVPHPYPLSHSQPGLVSALLCLLLLLLAAPVGLRAQEAPGLTAALEDYRTFRLADEGIQANGQTLKIGHLELTLRTGGIAPIVTDAGEPLGFYFEGAGNYVYVSEDPVDLQVMEANFAADSKASIVRAGKIEDRLERVLVYMARPEQTATWLPGEASAPALAGTAELKKGFEKIRSRMESSFFEWDHFAAQARLNGDGLQYVYTEIDGEQETVGHAYDRMRHFEESLFLFEKVSSYDLRYRLRVSEQWIDGGPAAVPGQVEHVDLGLDISTEDNKQARIVSEVTLRARRPDQNVIGLALNNNFDYARADWRSERFPLRVESVTDAQGRELPFSHRYHELLVELAEAPPVDREIVLRFVTSGDVLLDMSGDRSDNYVQLFGQTWYPEPFERSSIHHSLALKFETAKPYRPVGPGVEAAFEETDRGFRLETKSEDPVRYLALFAGKYKVYEEEIDGVRYRVFGYAAARKGVLEQIASLSAAFLGFYEKILGPYRFDHLNIIEVPEYGFGIAPPGTVLITTEAYKPRQDFLASYISRGINARLAHEIAHQWFGHRVAGKTSRDQWISESFAEYMAGLAMGAAAGKKRVYGLEEMYQEWWTDARASRDAGPIAAANMLNGPSAASHRFQLLYSRGPLVLRMLHSLAGNDNFYAVLRRFIEEADNGHATTADFARIASETLRTDVTWFVEQWVEEGGIPEIAVDHEVERAENGGYVLTGTARFADGSRPKRISIPVVIEMSGGDPTVQWIRMEDADASFSFPLPAKPKSVKIDPAKNFLAEFK